MGGHVTKAWLQEDNICEELKKRCYYNISYACKLDAYAEETKLQINEWSNRLSLEDKNILHAERYALDEKECNTDVIIFGGDRKIDNCRIDEVVELCRIASAERYNLISIKQKSGMDKRNAIDRKQRKLYILN